MAKKNKNKKSKQTENKLNLNPVGLFRSFLQGRVFLTLDFFKRNWLYVLAATVMVLMYIANKYTYLDNLERVGSLKKELNNATTDCVDASARYNSMIVESHMKALVDSMHIDLSSPDLPPYRLTED